MQGSLFETRAATPPRGCLIAKGGAKSSKSVPLPQRHAMERFARMPAVTVAICTHNRAGVIRRAVAEAVAQAGASGAEVLVLDNASSDDTPAILAQLVGRH